MRDTSAGQSNEDDVSNLGHVAFEALDLAAALFSPDLTLRTTNAAWRSLFAGDRRACEQGETLEKIFERFLSPSLAKPERSHATDDLIGRVRSCVRNYQLPRKAKGPLLLTSTPVKSGGYVVTLRAPDQHPVREESDLAVPIPSMEALGLGVLAWDAEHVVRASSDAWNRQMVPMSTTDTVDLLGERLAQHGFSGPASLSGGDTDFNAFLDAAHRHPQDWSFRQPDGRLIRLSTFPTENGGVVAVAQDAKTRQEVEAEAERMLSDALRSLGDGVLLLDGDLNCLICNDAFLKQMHDPAQPPKRGASFAEILSRSVAVGQYPLLDGTSLSEAAAAFQEEIIACRANVRMDMADGRILERSTFRTSMGEYVLLVRDVTERLGAQDLLHQSEQLTRKLVEELGVGVAMYDPDMRLQINNAAFRNLMFQDLPISKPGMHVLEEIRGTIAAGVLPLPPGMEDTGAEFLEQAVLAAMEAEEKGMEVIRSDGTILEAFMSATADGGYISVLHDVTDRKQAEQAAREADDLLRTIVENSPTTFLVTRFDDGKVVYAANPSRERFGNIESARSFFLDPSERETYLAMLSETGSLTDYPVRFRRKDGSVMEGLTSARIIEYKGERLIVSSTRDISEQVRLQQELERQRDLAHQNEKLSAMGGLLAGVAHELNNPLSIIVANAVMLEEDIQDQALRNRVMRLSSAAQRSSKIVKTFISMARKRPMRTEHAHINEIIETALEVSSYKLRSLGGDVQLALDPSDPALEVDADQIIQVLSNLVVNAEHAMVDQGEDARLTISTVSDGSKVHIDVADTGPGIPDDLRSRIFEPYFTTKSVGQGTGVGLAFCHRVALDHGGSIELLPDRGDGTVFRLTLPLSPATAPMDANRRTRIAPSDARILLLDDEEDVADTMSDVLRRAGYRVDTFRDAEAALGACRRSRYDAILSDVRMPGMDGPAFLQALRDTAPEQANRLVFLTGDLVERDDDGLWADTGRPYLEKPAELDEVVRVLEYIAQESRDVR